MLRRLMNRLEIATVSIARVPSQVVSPAAAVNHGHGENVVCLDN